MPAFQCIDCWGTDWCGIRLAALRSADWRGKSSRNGGSEKASTSHRFLVIVSNENENPNPCRLSVFLFASAGTIVERLSRHLASKRSGLRHVCSANRIFVQFPRRLLLLSGAGLSVVLVRTVCWRPRGCCATGIHHALHKAGENGSRDDNSNYGED